MEWNKSPDRSNDPVDYPARFEARIRILFEGELTKSDSAARFDGVNSAGSKLGLTGENGVVDLGLVNVLCVGVVGTPN